MNEGDGSVGTRRTRAWLARAILLVACVSIIAGLVLDRRQSRAEDPWRAKLVRSEPVEMRFLCGANVAIDCKATAKITYRKQDSKWCASLQLGDQRDVKEEDVCNADPEHGTISIFGVVHSFDRFGIVRLDNRLVAQMLPG